jgi:hypothetical protein
LTVGKGIDTLSGYFDAELLHVRMKFTDYAKFYSRHLDAIRKLQSITIKIISADMEVGLIGIKFNDIKEFKNELL